MVLDFCEWLTKKVEYDSKQREFDIYDLILNEEYNSRLVKYAEEYLAKSEYSIKGLLHRFIDSNEFDECLHHCHSYFQESRQRRHRLYPDDLRMLLRECYHCGRCDKYFDKFLRNIGETDQDTLFNSQISPWDLANNIRYSLEHESKPQLMQFMTVLNIDLSIEVDFLEWLIQTRGEKIEIDIMPLNVFEELASKYQKDCSKDERDKQKLIKAFKQSDNNVLSRKLLSILPRSTAKKAQSLGYIVDRYSNRHIPYRCVILPLAADSKEYKDLIEKRWYDLHHMSGDFLDIYYSKTDYGKSGYEIVNRLNYIPHHLSSRLPSIVLWQDDMSKAEGIDISRLDNTDIFEVISEIVALIQANMPFKTIIQEAGKVSEKCRDKDRAITNNTVNVNGNNYGIAIAENSGSIEMVATNNFDSAQFISEVSEAIVKIKESAEINEQQKATLIDVMVEAKEAVEKNSEEGKEKSKTRFKDVMCFMGNVAVKLLSSLSALANLAKFFGLPTP